MPEEEEEAVEGGNERQSKLLLLRRTTSAPATTAAAATPPPPSACAAAAASALATPSPGLALSLYPSLRGDYDAYCGALRPTGLAPRPLDAFVKDALGRGGWAAAHAPEIAAARGPPRLPELATPL